MIQVSRRDPIRHSLPTARRVGRNRRFACLLLCVIASTANLPAQDFSQPASSHPSPQAALVQQANDALTSGDLPTALKLLTDLNTQTPNNPQVLYNLGMTLEALADSSATATAPQPLTAESCYRAAIAADPTFAPPQVALGLLLARSGHPAEARTPLLAATHIPSIDPALKARALRALATIDLATDPPAASDDLLAALKLTPQQPDDILLSAQIAEAAADLPAAEQAYRRYLALPGHAADPAATTALGHVLLAQHHYAEAENLLLPALAHTPGDPALTAQLAQAYLDSGDAALIAKALPLVESLHTAHPADASITRLLARVYVETGHPEQADPLYAALIAGSPNPDPTLLDDSADALIRLHRPAAAEKLLKQAVANPDAFPTPSALADAALHLAFAASEADDPRTALQALALRAKVQPPSPPALFLEATANDDLHQSSKAAGLYRQFLTAANGTLPDQELQARRRLAAIDQRK